MSKYLVKSGEWAIPFETTGSIQNVSKSATIEVTSVQEANTGIKLAPMQLVNFDGNIFVRGTGSRDATFTIVPFKISRGGGDGGGSEYILPTASDTVKGGIMVGDGLKMEGDILNVSLSLATKAQIDDLAK